MLFFCTFPSRINLILEKSKSSLYLYSKLNLDIGLKKNHDTRCYIYIHTDFETNRFDINL